MKAYFESEYRVYILKIEKHIFKTVFWTVGSNIGNQRVSLAKVRTKGYLLIMSVDIRSNGADKIGALSMDGGASHAGPMIGEPSSSPELAVSMLQFTIYRTKGTRMKRSG